LGYSKQNYYFFIAYQIGKQMPFKSLIPDGTMFTTNWNTNSGDKNVHVPFLNQFRFTNCCRFGVLSPLVIADMNETNYKMWNQSSYYQNWFGIMRLRIEMAVSFERELQQAESQPSAVLQSSSHGAGLVGPDKDGPVSKRNLRRSLISGCHKIDSNCKKMQHHLI
jgi:hypothetical protein